MFEVSSFKGWLLVAFGSMSGAMLRFWIANNLRSISTSRYLGTFLVNISSAFALGLLLSRFDQSISLSNHSQLILLLGVGFLGSLSTFSTFIFEILMSIREQRWKEGIVWGIGSIVGGLIALATGYGAVLYE